jgi:hypothetical protein
MSKIVTGRRHLRYVQPRHVLAIVLLVGVLMSAQAYPYPLSYGAANDVLPEPDELQIRIEQTAVEYNKAIDRLNQVQGDIDALESQIAQLELSLPEQKRLGSAAVLEYYHMQCNSNIYLEMLFGSQSITDFISTYEYIGRVQSTYLRDINKLTQLQAELLESRSLLEETYKTAQSEAAHAEEALRDAQEARMEAERRARELQEANGNNAVMSAGGSGNAADAGAGGGADGGDGGAEAGGVSGPGEDAPGASVQPNEPPDWSQDKSAFVAMWAARIDAYLGGSPMGGQGYVFAEAAWDYGVDPRWSPAISCTESSKGLYCFLPHNAWGWGSVSWPDWDTAIRAHVRGLAIGYGYTISEAAAQKYCPPNWQHWLDVTSSQMALI